MSTTASYLSKRLQKQINAHIFWLPLVLTSPFGIEGSLWGNELNYDEILNILLQHICYSLSNWISNHMMCCIYICFPSHNQHHGNNNTRTTQKNLTFKNDNSMSTRRRRTQSSSLNFIQLCERDRSNWFSLNDFY